MRFDQIVIIGAGTIATECLRYLFRDLGIHNISVIETQDSRLSILGKVARSYKIEYASMVNPVEARRSLDDFSDNCKTLIISANNNLILQKDLLDRDSVVAINFHYSYLPDYRGVNIPTWVIYNNESYTGVTWHYVTSCIDGGDIIAQEKIFIKDDTTAYDIVREGMIKGTELFKAFIGVLLEKDMPGHRNVQAFSRIYKKNILPQDGMIDLSRSLGEIHRLLRSYDYKNTHILPALKFCIDNRQYTVSDYSLLPCPTCERRLQWENDTIILKESNMQLIIRKCEDN